MSIGRATAPYDGDSLDVLTQVADQRLYRAKQDRRRNPGAVVRDLPSDRPDAAAGLGGAASAAER